MSVADYRKKFIEPRTLNLPYYQCNLVGVDPKLHNLIKLATANTLSLIHISEPTRPY